jgi:predicted metal-dependent peptidase
MTDKMPRLDNYKRLDLDPKQDRLWQETRVALMWKCPAFTHILMTMLDNVNSKHVAVFTDAIPIAATDGRALLLNPEKFFKFNLYERVFIVAHEILHCVFNHCNLTHQMQRRGKVAYPDGKALDYEHDTMNIAMDLVINSTLVESDVGSMPKEGCIDQKLVTSKDSFLDSYRKVYQKKQNGGGGGGGGGGFDQHLEPGSSEGKDPHQTQQERNEGEWQTAVAQAANAAKAQGKLPGALERLLSEVLNPKVDWREHIQALFARRLGSGSYDWRRPDRRLIVQDIYSPGRSGFGAEFVVVGIDTSGSIGQAELNMFMAEVSGILEDVRPKRLSVVMCDARVHKIHECDSPGDLMNIKLVGGGGTDFRPVFDWIAKQGVTPDALVYLTDGLGSFPQHHPNYPVIWGNILPQAKYPFGDVVDVPKQAA